MTDRDRPPGSLAPRERWTPFLFLALAIAQFPKALLGGAAFFHYDTWLQNLAFRAWWFAQLKTGHFATWCPGMFGGYPLFAESQTGPLYPPTFVLFGLLPPTLAFSWSVGLHFAFAGAGAWLLARRLGASGIAALLAGIAFQLSGFLVTHVVHFNLLTGAAWMPWALVFALGAGEGRARSALGLAIAIACLLLGAHPYATLMTGMLVVLLVLFRAGGRPAAIGSAAATVLAAAVLGIALAAIQVLPTAELLARTTRGEAVDWTFLTFGSFPPWNLATLAAPDLFGSPVDGSYWGGRDWSHFAETCSFVAVPALALAVVAVLRARGPGAAFAGTAAALSFLLMLGKYTPLYRVMTWFPVLDSTRLPARFALPFTLALALLAAFGLDELIREPEARRRRRALVIAAAVLAGLAVVALGLGTEARSPGQALAETGRLWTGQMEAVRAAAGRTTLRLLVTFGATLLVLAPLARRARPTTRLAIPILLVALVDAALWGSSFNPTMAADALHAAPPAVRALPPAEPRPRIFRQGVDEMWSRRPGAARVDPFTPAWRGNEETYATGAWSLTPNANLLYGVDSGEGFTSLLPLDWLEWMGLPDAPGASPRPDLSEAQADLLSLDAVLSSGSGIAGAGWEASRLPGDLWLSRNLDPLPRVRLATAWRTAGSREEVLVAVRDAAHDPRAAVLLEAAPPGLPAVANGDSVDRPLAARETGPGAWEIEVPPGEERLVVVSERWDPDWRATTADGRSCPTLRAEGLLLGFVPPPAGGTVRLAHEPASVVRGAWISGIALGLLAVGLVAFGRGRRRLPGFAAQPATATDAARDGRGAVLRLGVPAIAVGAAAVLVVASGLADVGGWRADFRDSRLEAAAVRSWSDEALAAHRAGAPEAAVGLLRQALRVRPGEARLHWRLGIVERARGREAEARAAFARAAALDPALGDSPGLPDGSPPRPE